MADDVQRDRSESGRSAHKAELKGKFTHIFVRITA